MRNMKLTRRNFLKKCAESVCYAYFLARAFDLMLQLSNRQLNWILLFDGNYSYCSEIVEKAIEDQRIDIVVYDFCFDVEEDCINENILRKTCIDTLKTLDDFEVSVEYKK